MIIEINSNVKKRIQIYIEPSSVVRDLAFRDESREKIIRRSPSRQIRDFAR